MHLTGELTKAMAGGFSRRSRFAFVAPVPASLLVFHCYAAAAQPDLYAATVIVTGRDNIAERERGFREALPLVLTKLTADAGVAERAAAGGLSEKAEELVKGFDYVDRKEGIQISDEQGTRDRSFELTVRFDTARIDALLASLGATAWTGERPEIGVALLIDDGSSSYALTRASEKGYGQKLALEAEARALALPVRLPEAPAGDTTEAGLAAAISTWPVRLQGRMEVTPAGYWNTTWQLEGDGLDESFAVTDATFDVAIGEALRRSAKALTKR